MDIHVSSLGCRLNQSEAEEIAERFAAAGHTLVGDPTRADLCVINTCAVTAEAERKSRHTIRALARANPTCRLAVVGCYATFAPQQCAALPGVAWVIPNTAKDALPATLGIPAGAREIAPLPNPQRRTRAFIKVQDGCDNHCTFCLTRLLRGPARSRPPADIVAEIQRRVAEGYREIVLTGTSLGAYGRDLTPAGSLSALLRRVLAETDLPRLRLSSVEPWDLDEEFLRLWENPRLCRQLHLPLQSGCDETLRRMGRRTTSAEFARLVKAALAAVPEMALTTDIIVGFPGEDEAAFRASYDFTAALPFARLHVFPYSPRPGTPAVALPDVLPQPVRAARAQAMRALGDAQAARFRQQFVGREMTVLWESRRSDGLWSGLTDNYLRVIAQAEGELRNRLTPARLLAVENGCLIGEVVTRHAEGFGAARTLWEESGVTD